MSQSGLHDKLQRTLGDSYGVERELAPGGMSRVYLALDRTLGREVVIKALSPELSAEVNVERFAREVQLASRLQHPHILPLISAGDAEGTPFFIMPYVVGESLRERLSKGGEMPVEEVIRTLREVATALDYAHEKGIVHRDIKPENILLSGGSAVVSDFGVAKAISVATGPTDGTRLTATGVALGTPSYMAPEQAAADPSVDARADIYAWGVVAYEMLTGAPPFAGRSATAMIAAHISEPVPPIHRTAVPPRLAQLVMRSLAKRPADRPQSARELVRELDAIMSAGVTSAENPAGTARTGRRWLVPALALAAAAIAVSGWYFAHNRMAAPASSGVKRIAVMPFANASGTQDDDYFADGMSEELGATLGRVPGVQVASHSSAFSFKGKQIDVREVGRQLSVDAVLEGRVRRSGNRLRVTAQLTDVTNGLSLWSDSYERDSKDVFAVQDDIAKSIANALEVRFSQRQVSGSGTELQGTANPQAYDLYLRARYFWHRRGSENLRKSIDLFTQATRTDPRFARAYAGLASSEVLLTEYNDNAPADSHAKALEAADHALALDSSVAEAYLARGLVDVHMWKWGEAEKAYRTALALDSTSATAHQWLGELFYTLGEPDSSLAQLDKARALDPLAPIPATATAYSLFGARRFRDAIRQGLLAAELAPDLAIGARVLAESYLAIGDSTNALAQARRAVQLEPSGSQNLAMLVTVAAGVGRRDEALKAMTELKARPVAPVVLLAAYSGLGDRAQVLAALQQVIAQHDPTLSQYPLIDRTYDLIRDTDEFRRAAVTIGTPKAIAVPVH